MQNYYKQRFSLNSHHILLPPVQLRASFALANFGRTLIYHAEEQLMWRRL